MATDITIKRYDGSNWVELNPATSIGQVSGLQTALDTLTTNKQDKSNLVTSVSSSSTDAQYPSAKLFYDTTQSIMETAEGKTASYTTQVLPHTNGKKYLLCGNTKITAATTQIPTDATIDSSNNITVDGNTFHLVEVAASSDELNGFSSYTYLYKITYGGGDYTLVNNTSTDCNIKISDLNTGDILLLVPTNLPDFWWSGIQFYKLETTKVDLSDYVTTNTTQTGLTGDKTTEGTFTFAQTGVPNKISISNVSIEGYLGSQGTVLLDCMEGLLLYGITGKNDTKYGHGEIIVNNTATLTLPTTSGTLVIDSDLATYAPKASPTFTGTVELPTTTKITGITSTGNVRYANGVLSVDTTSYVPTTRTVNGKALSSDITLSASDVSALPSNTAYLASAGLSSDSRTLTITPSSGSAISFDSGNVTTLNATAPTSSKTGDIWFQTSA